MSESKPEPSEPLNNPISQTPDLPPPPEEEMPEFEELTPEYMEDECLRGDVMLRWALLLLAILLSWTTISDSSLFVRIRTGDAMIANRFLPQSVDTFSASAEGRPWVNHAWLSDIVMAITHRVAGFSGLTLLCVVAVAASFWLLAKINARNVSTWWGSVCGFFAAIALFPVLQPGPATVTVLGLSILLFTLCRERQIPVESQAPPSTRQFPWSIAFLPMLFLFWVNTDPRAIFGLVLFLAFMLGDIIARAIRKQKQSQRSWEALIVTVLVAILITPWPGRLMWTHYFSPRVAASQLQYGIVNELFPRLSYGLISPEFWRSIDIFGLAAIFLFGLSAVTLVLNARRLEPGWVVLWVVANLVSLANGEMVCYAAIVNATTATLNGQTWYSNRFSMAYSIDSFSVLWGRGGRAATVLTFFLLSYMAINGAFMGKQGRRIGLGLDPRWQSRLSSLEKDVVSHSFSDRIFPTIPSQGDALIWLHKKPFIDSRYSLYTSRGENLYEIHRQIRTALFAAPVDGKPVDEEQWKQPLTDYKTDDVLVRLWSPFPPYEPFFKLLANPSFVMTGLGSAGANFTRADTNNPEITAHFKTHNATDFAKLAFRPDPKPDVEESMTFWPLAPSTYQKWLVQKLETSPSDSELAAHYERILSIFGSGLQINQAAGAAVLTLRHARAGISETPNDPLGYRTIPQAIRFLQQIDGQLTAGANRLQSLGLQDAQTHAALKSAAIASGNDSFDLQRLMEFYLQRNHADLALESLDLLEKAVAEHDRRTDDQKAQFAKLREELDKGVQQVNESIQKVREQGADRAQMAALAINGRCPSIALKIMEEDLTEIEKSPDLKLLYSNLQMQCGNFDVAVQTLDGMEPMMSAPSLPPEAQQVAAQWKSMTAMANLATLNDERAVQLWEKGDDTLVRNAIRGLMQMPFGSLALPIQDDIWPAYASMMASNAAVEVPEQLAQVELQIAMAQLASGRLESAQKHLEKLLKDTPNSQLRFIAAMYLGQITNREIPVRSPVAEQTLEDAAIQPESAQESESTLENADDSPPPLPPTDDDMKGAEPAPEPESPKEMSPASAEESTPPLPPTDDDAPETEPAPTPEPPKEMPPESEGESIPPLPPTDDETPDAAPAPVMESPKEMAPESEGETTPPLPPTDDETPDVPPSP
ncbi:hypothetical protein SH668x_002103 [Planctomicrobium sp. SH668]|uniref:hypothetical protein n=1 Tax=Planctomicrobium sp. SH668 TaxID=3448126 RepID=UPI003F5C71B8